MQMWNETNEIVKVTLIKPQMAQEIGFPLASAFFDDVDAWFPSVLRRGVL